MSVGSKLVWFLPIVALIVALLDMPYGYYQVLRVVVFCVSVYLAYESSENGNAAWTWTLVGVAILYNPIFRMHLGAEVWTIINVISIGLFAAHMWHFYRRPSERRN